MPKILADSWCAEAKQHLRPVRGESLCSRCCRIMYWDYNKRTVRGGAGTRLNVCAIAGMCAIGCKKRGTKASCAVRGFPADHKSSVTRRGTSRRFITAPSPSSVGGIYKVLIHGEEYTEDPFQYLRSMRITAWLSIFGSAVSVSAVVPLPRELWERTGIPQAKIESILSQLPKVPGLGSPASTCTANTTIDGTWPNPTRSSSYDISKRSAFVKR